MTFFVETYKSIREKWLSKTPREKWSFCHKIGDYTLRLIGVNVYNDNSRYFFSFTTGILMSTYAILAMYTIVIYNKENNLKECLNCLCVSGLMASVCLAITNTVFISFNF